MCASDMHAGKSYCNIRNACGFVYASFITYIIIATTHLHTYRDITSASMSMTLTERLAGEHKKLATGASHFTSALAVISESAHTHSHFRRRFSSSRMRGNVVQCPHIAVYRLQHDDHARTHYKNACALQTFRHDDAFRVF